MCLRINKHGGYSHAATLFDPPFPVVCMIVLQCAVLFLPLLPQGHEEVVRELLRHNPSVGTLANGSTALHAAALSGDLPLCHRHKSIMPPQATPSWYSAYSRPAPTPTCQTCPASPPWTSPWEERGGL